MTPTTQTEAKTDDAISSTIALRQQYWDAIQMLSIQQDLPCSRVVEQAVAMYQLKLHEAVRGKIGHAMAPTPTPEAVDIPLHTTHLQSSGICVICDQPITLYDSYGVGTGIGNRYHWECVRKEAATVSTPPSEMERSRDGWKEDAERYAANAEHWKSRAERAEAARVQALKDGNEVLDDLEKEQKAHTETVRERDQHAETITRLEKEKQHWLESAAKATRAEGKRIAEITTLRADLERAQAERDSAKAQHSMAEMEVRDVVKLNEEYSSALRNICLLFGFDPSDGEGTSGAEVYDIVKTQLAQRPASPWVACSERMPMTGMFPGTKGYCVLWTNGEKVWAGCLTDQPEGKHKDCWWSLVPTLPTKQDSALPSARPAQAEKDACPDCKQSEKWPMGSSSICKNPWHAQSEKSTCEQMDESFGAPPVDPIAEVKAAHKAGKRIQFVNLSSPLKWHWEWNECPNPKWQKDCKYRIHPDDLPKPWTPRYRAGEKVWRIYSGLDKGISHVQKVLTNGLYDIQIEGHGGVETVEEDWLEPYVEPSPAQKMVAKTLEIFRIQQDGLEVKMTLTYQLSAEEGRPKGIGRTEAAAIQDLKDITP